ncbi:hypothetical protein DFS33DRAFT_1384717 [Desarmillaria ectypa]|nr:hypothetical protein DFS33DRAFT_1384717 [Desarmillaria ectypa]
MLMRGTNLQTLFGHALGAASFFNPSNTRSFSLKFPVGGLAEGNIKLGYSWKSTSSVDVRVYPDGEFVYFVDSLQPNQCDFLRGFAQWVFGPTEVSQISGTSKDRIPHFDSSMPYSGLMSIKKTKLGPLSLYPEISLPIPRKRCKEDPPSGPGTVSPPPLMALPLPLPLNHYFSSPYAEAASFLRFDDDPSLSPKRFEDEDFEDKFEHVLKDNASATSSVLQSGLGSYGGNNAFIDAPNISMWAPTLPLAIKNYDVTAIADNHHHLRHHHHQQQQGSFLDPTFVGTFTFEYQGITLPSEAATMEGGLMELLGSDDTNSGCTSVAQSPLDLADLMEKSWILPAAGGFLTAGTCALGTHWEWLQTELLNSCAKVNEFILENYPHVNVAITHFGEWSSALSQGDDSDVLLRVLSDYKVIVHDGLAMLEAQ